MNLFKRLFGPKDVNVTKVKKESIDIGMQAAGNMKEAVGALGRMLDQSTTTSKVLMVQEGEYNEKVIDYACKLSQRLDCGIIALDVLKINKKFNAERKKRELDRFVDVSDKNYSTFKARATAKGIKVEHITKVGNVDEVIANLQEEDAGIRYVLSAPTEASNHIPVYDLTCSKLSNIKQPRLYK